MVRVQPAISQMPQRPPERSSYSGEVKLPSTPVARPMLQMQKLSFVRIAVFALATGMMVSSLPAQETPRPPEPFGRPMGRPFQSPQQQAQPAATLPATPPTALPTAIAPLTATPVTPEQPKLPSHRAIVTFNDGLLNVRADNSSLNQILREICRRTGMTITGGVADQRVFGNYGPAEASTILATLLDGTGTNMLLRESPTAPVELVLTQRTGGATPPNPNAPGFDDGPVEPDAERLQESKPAAPVQQTQAPARFQPPPAQPFTQTTTTQTTVAQPVVANKPDSPQQIPQPLNNPLGSPSNTSPTASTLPTASSVDIDTVNTPSTVTAPAQGIVDAPNPPPTGAATGSEPSTPDQIYQQLLMLQKKSQPVPTPGTTTTTTTTTTATPQ